MAPHPTLATYCKTWLALMGLLAVTILAAHFHLGAFALGLALLIATVKAVLILLFFMQVHYSKGEIVVVACAGYIWLTILLLGTLHDYWSRDWVPGPENQAVAPGQR